MKNRTWKRIFSTVIIAGLLLAGVPGSAMAADTDTNASDVPATSEAQMETRNFESYQTQVLYSALGITLFSCTHILHLGK